MTDILERLNGTYRAEEAALRVMDDAAAEIERLRAALRNAANDLDDWGAYTKANKARAALEGKG